MNSIYNLGLDSSQGRLVELFQEKQIHAFNRFGAVSHTVLAALIEIFSF